jgi:hypothetical protein
MSGRRWAMVAVIAMGACKPADETPAGTGKADTTAARADRIADRVARYSTVRLTADLAPLTARERQMIPLLIDAAREMDTIYWREAYGSRDSLLASLTDPSLRRFAEINYGPWDRLEDNRLFVPEVGAKPAGAGFYPTDLTAADFQTAAVADPALKSPYTIVRRDSAGKLRAVPYHVAFAEPTARAAAKLREAAGLADDAGLRTYLEARAKALETDNYRASDIAWLDMKKNRLDIVIGPIETYEDALAGVKTAHEAYVLIKDLDWSRRLARYAAMLPGLQRGLPVPEQFKRERPGTDSELNAYDVIYYAGQANAGGKTIAINLPNDEQVQLQKGTRRLQLKNAMRAKFDRIMVPIADALIAPDQQKNVTFDAFFENTMFHEVAHGLGIKQTINGKGTVRQALKERNSGLEEEKADVLGLYMVAALNAQGELKEDLLDNYVTFLAGIIRSVRFGAADAHGRANMATFSFLQERGAFVRDSATGTYRVDQARMADAVNALAGKILQIQGTGDYAGLGTFMETSGKVGPTLQADLDRLKSRGIPVDIIFEQGPDVLGLDGSGH